MTGAAFPRASCYRVTTIDFVPPNEALPPTVFTVKVTEVVRFRMPDLLTEHGAGVVAQLAVPLVPATVDEAGTPSFVTATVTVAIQVEPC